MVFFVVLLRHFIFVGVFRRLVATFYFCGGDSDRQNKFLSNYDRRYVEELVVYNIVTILSNV